MGRGVEGAGHHTGRGDEVTPKRHADMSTESGLGTLRSPRARTTHPPLQVRLSTRSLASYLLTLHQATDQLPTPHALIETLPHAAPGHLPADRRAQAAADYHGARHGLLRYLLASLSILSDTR